MNQELRIVLKDRLTGDILSFCMDDHFVSIEDKFGGECSSVRSIFKCQKPFVSTTIDRSKKSLGFKFSDLARRATNMMMIGETRVLIETKENTQKIRVALNVISEKDGRRFSTKRDKESGELHIKRIK